MIFCARWPHVPNSLLIKMSLQISNLLAIIYQFVLCLSPWVVNKTCQEDCYQAIRAAIVTTFICLSSSDGRQIYVLDISSAPHCIINTHATQSYNHTHTHTRANDQSSRLTRDLWIHSCQCCLSNRYVCFNTEKSISHNILSVKHTQSTIFSTSIHYERYYSI